MGVTALLATLGIGALVYGAAGDSDASVPTGVDQRPAASPPTASVPPTDPMPPAEPTRIDIPALDISAPIIKLELRKDGELEVPPGAERAGWYTGSPAPGELGPAIVAAHINYDGQDGPFAELDTLKPGDVVTIERADGTTARFRIDTIEQYDKDQFPTQKVYGNIDHAGLRLITCGGAFNPSIDSYEDNIVAYAHLVRSPPSSP